MREWLRRPLVLDPCHVIAQLLNQVVVRGRVDFELEVASLLWLVRFYDNVQVVFPDLCGLVLNGLRRLDTPFLPFLFASLASSMISSCLLKRGVR